jgi:hypothetical protein
VTAKTLMFRSARRVLDIPNMPPEFPDTTPPGARVG